MPMKPTSWDLAERLLRSPHGVALSDDDPLSTLSWLQEAEKLGFVRQVGARAWAMTEHGVSSSEAALRLSSPRC
eukprot:4838327-Alexandrium_andersonii.AAC.1